VTVILTDDEDDRYRTRVEGLNGVARPGCRRSVKPRRLVVQFSASSMRVLLDDHLLWYSLKEGPGGPLIRWRLACVGRAGRQAAGQVVFSAFCLQRGLDESRRPAGDLTQDEVWLASGDQLFGRLLTSGREGVTLEGRFGRRSLPWSKVRAVFPRESPRAAPAEDQVRLTFDNGFDAVPDVIYGTLGRLTDRELTLRHPGLGEVVLERGRLRRLEKK
jgi:hypothetical protein